MYSLFIDIPIDHGSFLVKTSVNRVHDRCVSVQVVNVNTNVNVNLSVNTNVDVFFKISMSMSMWYFGPIQSYLGQI